MTPLNIKTHREWTDPQGYRWLVQWTNLVLLRHLIRVLTASFPKSEYRRVNQMNDAGRSMVSTLEEGFKRPTTKEYLDFLGFTQGSLEEVKGDNFRNLEDGLIKSRPGSSLKDLGIDLKEFKGFIGKDPVRSPLKDSSKGPLTSSNQSFNVPIISSNYPPLKSLKASDLTYEIFLELINKTDFVLRNLVCSLQESGSQKEELKKNPGAWQEGKNDNWLEKHYLANGFTKNGDLWVAPASPVGGPKKETKTK